MKTLKIGFILSLLATCLSTAFAAEIQTPLVVWDVNFNDQTIDAIPHGMSNDQLDAFNRKDDLSWIPLKTYNQMAYVTRTRQAKIVQEAAGLKDKPMLFTHTELNQPHYGPQVLFNVPWDLAVKAKKWHLTLDVSKGSVEKSDGVTLWDVAGIKFHEDGTVRVNGTEISRYASGKPLHMDFLISVPEKTVTVMFDGDTKKTLTLPWYQPNAAVFLNLRLDGVLPGGYCFPSSIAFDNIKLTLEELNLSK
ncbi:MAG: hypothetical protein WAX69_14600 [Victivallales bacterium]